MDKPEWDAAKHVVAARDGHCLRCLGEATDVHHRVSKGMGGTSDPEINYGLANLISLCRMCHEWVHLHPKQAYQLGYLVHSWESPQAVPVTVKPGTVWVELTDDGELRTVEAMELF